jgi:hypothetical protein
LLTSANNECFKSFRISAYIFDMQNKHQYLGPRKRKGQEGDLAARGVKKILRNDGFLWTRFKGSFFLAS